MYMYMYLILHSYSYTSFLFLDSVQTTEEPANTPSSTTEGKNAIKIGCVHCQEITIHRNNVD